MRFRSHCRPIVIAALLFAVVCAPAWSADKKDVLRRSGASLYNLKADGLVEFSCQASPDFDTAYKDIKMDEVGRTQMLPAAKNIRFQVAVGPSGAANVSHQFAEAPPNQEIADRLQKVAGGMEQIIGGFFKTWSSLMMNSPFTGSPDDYQMDEVADGYRVTADAGSTHVEILLDHSYTPTSISARSTNFDGTVRPIFIKRKDKSLLQSYAGSSKTSGRASQDLSMKIEYQDVEGLAIPRTIEAIMILPQGRLDAPITLSNCQVKKRP